MLLAVFVAHDCRPWLSVTGICVAGFGLCVRNGSESLSRADDGLPVMAFGDTLLQVLFRSGYRLAPSNFFTFNWSTSTPSRQRTLSMTMSLPPGPLP
jgi:hypothetical protein